MYLHIRLLVTFALHRDLQNHGLGYIYSFVEDMIFVLINIIKSRIFNKVLAPPAYLMIDH